jgi:hypothetical protein
MSRNLLSLPLTLLFLLVPVACETDATDPVGERCGNSVVEEDEVCDGTTSEQYCSEDCSQKGGFCGDGIVETEFGEACDTLRLGSGEGGAGGGGGASSGENNPGCNACAPLQGYVCDSEGNTCQQTGVDADEKTSDHIPELCEWFIGLSGGEGTVLGCIVDEERWFLTIASEGSCEETFEVNDECSIGDMEAWARSRDICEIQYQPSPCDP